MYRQQRANLNMAKTEEEPKEDFFLVNNVYFGFLYILPESRITKTWQAHVKIYRKNGLESINLKSTRYFDRIGFSLQVPIKYLHIYISRVVMVWQWLNTTINGEVVEMANKFIYLGVNIDYKLNVNNQF